MENLAFLQDFTNKTVAHRRAALESCRRPHDEVQWKPSANPAPDPSRLLSCGPAVFHHDEQIDIRVGLRFSRCMGTEHDDPLRRKFPDEFGHVLFDPSSRDHDLPSSVRDPKDSPVNGTHSMIDQV
jgi:hypothetical protein